MRKRMIFEVHFDNNTREIVTLKDFIAVNEYATHRAVELGSRCVGWKYLGRAD